MRKMFFVLAILSLISLSACSHNKETINNELDLTNCASFFDGCNICTVESGSITSCTTNECGMTGEIGETKCLKTVEELNEQKKLSNSDIE